MAKKTIPELPPAKKLPAILEKEPQGYPLDFYNSDSLDEIESGIKDVQKGIYTSNLAIALAIVRIDREALYYQAEYKTYTEYFREADTRLSMPKQTISDLKKIGESYLENRSALQRIKFIEEGNLHKLRYLEMALQKHDNATEVFKRLKADSFRKFKEYAEEESERSDLKTITPEYMISMTKKGINLDGNVVLTFDPGLEDSDRKGISATVKEYFRVSKGNLTTITLDVESEEEEKEIARYLREIYKIKENGNVPCIVGVYDQGEKTTVKRKTNVFLKQYREKK